MSNQVTIEPTRFVDERTGRETLGFRVYDDYEQTYCNNMSSIPGDDLEFFRMALENIDNALDLMLDYMCMNEKGITIGNEFYDFEEVKSIIDEAKNRNLYAETCSPEALSHGELLKPEIEF